MSIYEIPEEAPGGGDYIKGDDLQTIRLAETSQVNARLAVAYHGVAGRTVYLWRVYADAVEEALRAIEAGTFPPVDHTQIRDRSAWMRLPKHFCAEAKLGAALLTAKQGERIRSWQFVDAAVRIYAERVIAEVKAQGMGGAV